MSGLAALRRASRSLAVRMSALLTVALLPLGLIAVVQTEQVNTAAREREDLVFLALTEQAASRERRVIERAIGVVQGLAVAVADIAEDDAACDARMRMVAGGAYPYTFAGYIPASGVMTCSSEDGVIDFSGQEEFAEFARAPRTTVIANPSGAATGLPVVVISEPLRRTGTEFGGFVSVSIPQEVLPSDVIAAGPVDLLTFNDSGEVLKSSTDLSEASSALPRGVPLSRLVDRPADVFEGEDLAGRPRVFAVVPIVPGVVYTLGSWDRSASVAAQTFAALPVQAFPLLMWAMSLAVAYFAVHHLVIRHVRLLVMRMRAFASDRTMPPSTRLDAPEEPREIEAGLAELIEKVMRDEAEAENRLHEQKVMMKEIHHRVKNNLQLISSIINMQMRQIEAPSTRMVLGRVRDRVLGLATIHRNLYEASDVTGVAADGAVRDIVAQLSRSVSSPAATSVRLDLDPLLLYPDQAVPLSLFVTEALTNAIKHGGGGGGGEISVRLADEGRMARLEVENTMPAIASQGFETAVAGLGNRLIRAFATQLEGQVDVERTGGTYRVTLVFPREGFAETPAAPPAEPEANGGPDPDHRRSA